MSIVVFGSTSSKRSPVSGGCNSHMAKAILWIYQQLQHICIRDMVIAPTYYEA